MLVYGSVYRTEVVECVCTPLSALQLFCWVISVEIHRVFSVGTEREEIRRLKNSQEGHSEVEPLPQASEGDEGLSGETARGHLTVGLLVLPRQTLAHESTSKAIHALAPILTHAGYTPARRCIYLTVLT